MLCPVVPVSWLLHLLERGEERCQAMDPKDQVGTLTVSYTVCPALTRALAQYSIYCTFIQYVGCNTVPYGRCDATVYTKLLHFLSMFKK